MRPAIFFDRDGVLNVDRGYTHRAEDLVWVDGAIAAIAEANRRGCYVFVITNQAGVAHGLYGEDAVRGFHEAMRRQAAAAGARIDDLRYCPHHPDGRLSAYRRACSWRKPAPGMILDLMARWPVRREGSLVIGDRQSDLAAARAAGLPGVLFRGGPLSSALPPR